MNINFQSFLTKGMIIWEAAGGELKITAASLNDRFDKFLAPINSYIYLSDKFKLPVQIDLTTKIDSPCLYILFGDGHLTFGSNWDDNRSFGDIMSPDLKPHSFDNRVPYNTFFKITLLYHTKFMQILVDGEERYFSNKEKYMKLLSEDGHEGFDFKISCGKRTELMIKSLHISPYPEEFPMPAKSLSKKEESAANLDGQRPDFASIIEGLSKELKNEVIKTDAFLLSLKHVKFRRQLDKNGHKITYLASHHGFSYSLNINKETLQHSLWWYILTNSKPELWHRKSDMLEETLDKLAETSPDFAQQMFERLVDCVGCTGNCAVKTPYKYSGKKKIACHGKLGFKMTVSDFMDVRRMIEAVNSLCEQ